MDLSEAEPEGEELDYEWPLSPHEQGNSPKLDNGAETDEVCDFGSITKSPDQTTHSPNFGMDVGEPNSKQHSDVSTPMTEGCCPEVAVNLESLKEDNAETTDSPGAPTRNAAPSMIFSPKVTVNPRSLLFLGISEEGEKMGVTTDSRFDSTSGSFGDSNSPETPQMVTGVSFDPSSLLGKLKLSGSDDKSRMATTDGQTNSDSLDKHTVNSNLSCDHELRSAMNSVDVAPSGRLRGILKCKPLLISNNEKIVADCLKLLCQPAVNDTDEDMSPEDVMLSSAKVVFKNLCFDQFFREGECFRTICDDNHHYKTHSFSHSSQKMWCASVYVICHSPRPNLQVIENLVQHYTAKGNMLHALAFAKCICKLKDTDKLELAHFMVNKLSDTIPTRDVITVILMLNFSGLTSVRYNQLMEGLGVFEQNTTHYRELMAFLNFRGHRIPARFLCKLMEDSMMYSYVSPSEIEEKKDDSMVKSISGFFKRLHPSEKDDVQPIANDFEERFGVLPVSDDLNQIQVSEYGEPKAKRLSDWTKKVNFATEPDVREFEAVDCPTEVQFEADMLEGDFSDDCEDEPKKDLPNFYGSSDSQAERLVRVFGETCRSWILNGRCSNASCSFTHNFNKDSLAQISPEDVYAAADYIITQSQTPSLKILKIFIEFFCQCNETVRALSFRRCAFKMSISDSVKLTGLVISLLSKQIGVWEAIEKVLVPDEMNDLQDDPFVFDERLLFYIMNEAIKTKTTVLRYVTGAITHYLAKLPVGTNANALSEIIACYNEKFVKIENQLPPSPCMLPAEKVAPTSFASHLKVALYQGVPSKYFLATAMMKQAIDDNLRDQAFDVLYTFLLSNYDRARALTHLLENCKYLSATDRTSAEKLIGSAGLTTSIRLYENENFAGTAELFTVLKKFKLNIFQLLPSEEKMTDFSLAAVYCDVTVDTVNRNDAIDVFLNRCVDPYLNGKCPPGWPALMKLTSKMFHVLTSALLVDESLKLYKGIVDRQKSWLSPLNIVNFVEPTLRCTFNRLYDTDVRKESLFLYLEAVDSGTPITFQKVTHRSVFLVALMEITDASQKFLVKGHVNVIHPLIKKILLMCINEGAYCSIYTPEITMYSSMTTTEIEVYMMWWFFLYARARKRQAFDYFEPITVKIVQDCVRDDSRLPLHPSLRSVSTTITDCAERVASVIKMAVAEQVSVVATRERGVFKLDASTARALTQTAINIMLQHRYLHAGKPRICTFCFDKSEDVILADKL